MNWQVVFEPETSGRLCLTLLHSLWQVALAALVAGVAGRLLCRCSVERSYLVHAAALVVSLIAVPTTFAWLSQEAPRSVAAGEVARMTMAFAPSEREAAQPESMARAVAAEPAGPLLGTETLRTRQQATGKRPTRWERWTPLLAGFYAVGVAAMFARVVAGVVRADRLRRTARPLVMGPAAASLQRLARQWNVRALPALAHAERIVVPALVGLFKPTILLPASALAGLSTGELEMILAHELAHVRRRDMWVNLLQRLAEVALFFNPALWYLSRRIATLREYCCDEYACRAAASPTVAVRVDYATALLRVVELTHPHSAAYSDLAALAASGRSPSDLRRRIARLLGEPLREPLGISRGGLQVGGAIVLAMLVAPAWLRSQTPDSDPQAYPPPRSEADEAVAAARKRTFGLHLVPRISMKQRVKSGGVGGMAKTPELSLKRCSKRATTTSTKPPGRERRVSRLLGIYANSSYERNRGTRSGASCRAITGTAPTAGSARRRCKGGAFIAMDRWTI